MRKLLTILLITATFNCHAQTLSTDSLSVIIRTLQSQVKALQSAAYSMTIYFDSTVYLVQNNPDTLNKKVSMRPWVLNSLQLAGRDSVRLDALQSKVYGLKATTTIQ